MQIQKLAGRCPKHSEIPCLIAPQFCMVNMSQEHGNGGFEPRLKLNGEIEFLFVVPAQNGDTYSVAGMVPIDAM